MSRRKALIALFGLLVVAGQGMAGSGAGAATTGPPRLTKPVGATRSDTDATRTYTSPSIAVDPENSNNIVMGYVEARTRRCGLLRSTDAGQSWTKLDASPSPQQFPSCFVISGNVDMIPVAFGRNHTLYYGLSGYDDTDGGVNNGNVTVLLAKSTDLGDHWTTTVVMNNRGKQAPDTVTARPVSDIAVDTSGAQDTVYVAWRAEYRTTTAPNLQPRLPLVAVSHDGGKTFAAPVNVAAPAWDVPANRAAALSTATTLPGATPPAAPPAGSRAATPDQAANFGGSNPSLTVDSKGKVYVAWVTHWSNLTPAPLPAIWLATSADGGKTYTENAITPFQAGMSTFGTQRIRWSPGGGANGTLHVVYEGPPDPKIAAETDVFYQRSTDGGKTWSAVKTLNDDTPLHAQNSPNISVAPNGRVDVAWFDARNDPGIRAQDVYMASSSDAGATWTKNIRMTDQIIDRRIGIWANGFDVSDPPGIASTDKLTVVAWDDTRNFDQTTQGQDLYTSEAQYAKLGGGTSKVAKGIVAGVVGIGVVGLVLLMIGLVNRRGAGGGGGGSAAATRPKAQAAKT